jgi:hypothetical protein
MLMNGARAGTPGVFRRDQEVIRSKRSTVLMALAAVVLIVTATSAFVITNTGPRASVAGAAARAPGQMVNAGAARHRDRLIDFASPPEITETASPDFFTPFLADAVEIIFDEVNQALELLLNVLFIRAGQDPPFLPQLPETPDPDEMNENGETAANSRLSLTQRSIHRLDGGH